MKLPFIILNRTTFEKLVEHDRQLQTELDEHVTDLIQRREEVKNLRYNYERVKDEYQTLKHSYNKQNHDYNALKKKYYATNRSKTASR